MLPLKFHLAFCFIISAICYCKVVVIDSLVNVVHSSEKRTSDNRKITFAYGTLLLFIYKENIIYSVNHALKEYNLQKKKNRTTQLLQINSLTLDNHWQTFWSQISKE